MAFQFEAYCGQGCQSPGVVRDNCGTLLSLQVVKNDEQVVTEVTLKICICDVPASNLGVCYRLA